MQSVGHGARGRSCSPSCRSAAVCGAAWARVLYKRWCTFSTRRAGPSPPPSAFRDLFGLTPAEAALAQALAAGRSLHEYADEARVTCETARWRLKQVLAKTDTHRQAELVRLLLTSAVLGEGLTLPDGGCTTKGRARTSVSRPIVAKPWQVESRPGSCDWRCSEQGGIHAQTSRDGAADAHGFRLAPRSAAADFDAEAAHAKFIDAFNNRQWAEVKALLAADSVFHRANAAEVYSGPDAIVGHFEQPIGGEWNVKFARLNSNAQLAGKDGRVVERGDFAITAGADDGSCYAGSYLDHLGAPGRGMAGSSRCSPGRTSRPISRPASSRAAGPGDGGQRGLPPETWF